MNVKSEGHRPLNKDTVTLCFPDQEKSCFACCPPIRPAGYEHIQYRSIIARMLRENTAHFNRQKDEVSPVTGFSCWALGYVDQQYRLVGCLLHPAHHDGIDLRYRIDYHDKCRREVCHEAKTFSGLRNVEKNFWLHMAEGLDSFSFSSRKINPLFNMLQWGIPILGLVASEDIDRIFSWDGFLATYPFFATNLPPKANAYLIDRMITKETLHLLGRRPFGLEFEKFSKRLSADIKKTVITSTNSPYVHLLDLDSHFSDFLRLSCHIGRAEKKDVLLIRDRVDQEIDCFMRNVLCRVWRKRSSNSSMIGAR
ncbi:MAG: hypothetical protein JRJ85_07950 [Deltaproteobacteria bacterium]|nr:hypothetical protein [Deltaproteobacteria bacterium]